MLLQYTYPYFIGKEETEKRARAQMRPGDWSMVKRVQIMVYGRQIPPAISS
jgi:hypothetical protein